MKAACVPPVERLNKWGEELRVDLDTDEWLDNYNTIGNFTAITQLKSFSYRFQVRDVMTNNRLFKVKLSDSEMCYLCNQTIDNKSHLYWECKINKRLWERLKEVLF